MNLKLIVATAPTVIMVILFNSFFEENFSTSSLVWGFLISAILLAVADLKKSGQKTLTKKSALCMGVTQGLALLPGISRSGSTLTSGLLLGIDKQEALDFSFLMSIPIILASAVYESFKLLTCQITVNWLGIFIVMITSFVFGIISIKIMLRTIKNNKLIYFSFYLIALSLIILLFL
jgi:undecaprenyl-diphosphatase